MDYSTIEGMWSYTVNITYLVWLVCIISFTLNFTRNNKKRAIFSLTGLWLSIIAIITSTAGKYFGFRGIYTKEALIIFAFLMQNIILILSFIFCFSKNNKNNQQK